MRLDMDWRHWRRAAERGLLCAINPDAHAIEHYDFHKLRVFMLPERGGLHQSTY